MESKSNLETKAPEQSKVLSSPNSTPVLPESKGIKLNAGFIDPSVLFKKNPAKINNIVICFISYNTSIN